jgi:hypothetical protein
MNRTKKLLFGLVSVAAMPAFADTKATTNSSGEEHLEELFKADLQNRSDSQSDAVVVAEGRGSGDGTVPGDRLRGTIRWSLWSENCLYPLVRSGQSVPKSLHLCSVNPVVRQDGKEVIVKTDNCGHVRLLPHHTRADGRRILNPCPGQ